MTTAACIRLLITVISSLELRLPAWATLTRTARRRWRWERLTGIMGRDESSFTDKMLERKEASSFSRRVFAISIV